MGPRIRVEDKHTYKTNYAVIYSNRPNNAGIIYNSVVEYVIPNYPVTGTDEHNRLGRKISTTSIVTENYYSLIMEYNGNSITLPADRFAVEMARVKSVLAENMMGLLGSSEDIDAHLADFVNSEIQRNLKFEPTLRHFIVEFDSDAIDLSTPGQSVRDQLGDWFTQTYIYTTSENDGISNQQRVLRESTSWTGRFRILHDSLLKFTLNDPIKHEVMTLKYPRYLNFDGTGNDYPTDKILIEFWIGPINNMLDFGSVGLGKLINASFTPGQQYALFRIDSNMKLNFTDM